MLPPCFISDVPKPRFYNSHYITKIAVGLEPPAILLEYQDSNLE